MKPRKLSQLGTIRKLRADLRDRDLTIAVLRTSETVFATRLDEARRRTIPLGDHTDCNFLPSRIESIKMDQDTAVFRTRAGISHQLARGPCVATITASGEIVTIQRQHAEKEP